MSKKHFIALANMIRNNGTFTDEQISALADFCRTQNPDFKGNRWIGYIKGENGASGGKVKAHVA